MLRPAGLIIALGVALLTSPNAWAATSGTPYHDASAVGRIGLCDRAGNAVTSGSVNAKPFVWRAVSTKAAVAPYDASGRTATFYAYQPREDVPAGDWSGDQLTATSRYTNAAHPMAQATGGDESLKDFIAEFRPSWNGLLQLRMFLGAPGRAIDSFSYPATTIKVTGNTWRVIDPVNVSCSSGKAESIESILLPKSTTAGKSGGQATPTHRRHRGGTSEARARPTNRVSPLAPTNAASAADESRSGGGHSALIGGGLFVGLFLVAACGFAARRRRDSALPARRAPVGKEDK